MKRFVQGHSRTQGTLLPECLDDYVVEDNPVRVIDVFVDGLDLRKLGFDYMAHLVGAPLVGGPLSNTRLDFFTELC